MGSRAMHALSVTAIAAIAIAAHDATAGRCRDAVPKSWDIEVAPASELGERFILTGRVRTRGEGKPLRGVTVYVYHADLHGQYNTAGNEGGEPRLCGVLITNDRGEYRVRMTMPGGYGGFAPHVHFEVWGPRVSRQPMFVNLHVAPASQAGRHIDTTGVAWRSDPRPSLLTGTTPTNEETVGRGRDGVLRCSHDLFVSAR